MRNLLFVLFATLLFFGCKKDDDSQDTVREFSLRITEECPQGGIGVCYDVTETVVNQVTGGVVAGEPCNYVSFMDIGGTRREGYFASGGSGGCD